MRKLGMALVALSASLVLAPSASAQRRPLVVLVVDPGPVRVNIASLGHAIEGALERPVVRMTDDRAQSATGRLTIGFSSPNRWVLRYESEGQVGWVRDRIIRPGLLRRRLAELSRDLVQRVETAGAERPSDWGDDVVIALRDEILDPFDDTPPPQARPISVLWSEVVDPFRDEPPRAHVRQVWSEVLDPWASEARRHH